MQGWGWETQAERGGGCRLLIKGDEMSEDELNLMRQLVKEIRELKKRVAILEACEGAKAGDDGAIID